MHIIRFVDIRSSFHSALEALRHALPEGADTRPEMGRVRSALGKHSQATRMTLEEARESVSLAPDSVAGRAFAQALKEAISQVEARPTKAYDRARFAEPELAAAAQLTELAYHLGQCSVLLVPLAETLISHASEGDAGWRSNVAVYAARRDEIEAERIAIRVAPGPSRRVRRTGPPAFAQDVSGLQGEWVTSQEVEALAPGTWSEISRLLGIIYGDLPEFDTE